MAVTEQQGRRGRRFAATSVLRWSQTRVSNAKQLNDKMPDVRSHNNNHFEDEKVQIEKLHANTSPEELMEGLTIPFDIARTEPRWWGVLVTPQSSMNHMTTYMGEQLKIYELVDMCDGERLGAFQVQFEGWTEEMFKKVHHIYLREIKKLLRARGTNTGSINGRVAAQLTKLLEHD